MEVFGALVDGIDGQEDQESTVEGLGLVANPRNDCNSDSVADSMCEHVAAALAVDICHTIHFFDNRTIVLEGGLAASLVGKRASVSEEPDPVHHPPAEVDLGGVDEEILSQVDFLIVRPALKAEQSKTVRQEPPHGVGY